MHVMLKLCCMSCFNCSTSFVSPVFFSKLLSPNLHLQFHPKEGLISPFGGRTADCHWPWKAWQCREQGQHPYRHQWDSWYWDGWIVSFSNFPPCMIVLTSFWSKHPISRQSQQDFERQGIIFVTAFYLHAYSPTTPSPYLGCNQVKVLFLSNL